MILKFCIGERKIWAYNSTQQLTLKDGNDKMNNTKRITYSITLEYIGPHVNSSTVPTGQSISFQINTNKEQNQNIKEQQNINMKN